MHLHDLLKQSPIYMPVPLMDDEVVVHETEILCSQKTKSTHPKPPFGNSRNRMPLNKTPNISPVNGWKNRKAALQTLLPSAILLLPQMRCTSGTPSA